MFKRPSSDLRRAIPAVLFACFIYAILSAAVKEELTHLSVPGILFWRYAISLFLFIPIMLYQTRGIKRSFKPTSLRMYLIRVSGTLLGVYLYSTALKSLSIAMASLLLNTMPLFIPIVIYVWKKVPINHQLWWGFGVALVGVALVLSPHQVHWNKDMLFAIGAGLSGSFSVVALRYTHFEEPSYRINLYFFLLALILTIPLTFFNIDQSWRSLTLKDIGPLLVIGAAGYLYQQSFTFSLKHAPARFLAPFMYSSVIWGMILDRFLWGVPTTLMMWMGTTLIVLGNILIYILYPKKDLTS